MIFARFKNLIRRLLSKTSNTGETKITQSTVTSVVQLKSKYRHFSDVPVELWRWSYFTPEEVACNGTGEIIIHEEALDVIQALRAEWGKPISPTSWYRSVTHNKAVGGAVKSQHLTGGAIDVPLDPSERNDFVTLAKKHGFRGFGYYDTFMHIDMGESREWDRRS